MIETQLKTKNQKITTTKNKGKSHSHQILGKKNQEQQEDKHQPGSTKKTEQSERVITIRLTKGESLVVPIKINNTEAEGVLDSGAECCLISTEIFQSLNPTPKILDQVQLQVVGKGLTPAWEIEVNTKVGSTNYHGLAYVCDLHDDCLLGLDFMKTVLCDILISEGCIRIGGPHGEKVPATFKKFGVNQKKFGVSRATLAK